MLAVRLHELYAAKTIEKIKIHHPKSLRDQQVEKSQRGRQDSKHVPWNLGTAKICISTEKEVQIQSHFQKWKSETIKLIYDLILF